MTLRIVVLVATLMFGCSLATAAPVLSCDEVNEMGEALTGLAIALESGAEIGEDSPEDQSLRDVIDGLSVIADAEGDAELREAANGMDRAWHDMDGDAFSESLAYAVGKLAVIATEECE